MAKEIKLSPQQTIIKKMNAYLPEDKHLNLATEATTGKQVIVDQKGVIPNNGQVSDVYYPAFLKVLTDISIDNFLTEEGTQIFRKLFARKLTTNGVKRILYWATGGNIYDYTSPNAIADFNAANPNGYSTTWGIDFTKYVKAVQPSVNELVAIMKNPSQTNDVVSTIVKQTYETMKLFVQAEQTKIILDTPDSVLSTTGVHTITVDVHGLDYQELITIVNDYKYRMTVTSPELLNLTDKLVMYSGNPATDITEIWEAKYDSGLQAETSKVWFQKSGYENYKNEKIVAPFTTIVKNAATGATFTDADVDGFKLALVDNRKFEEIYQLQADWSVIVPKLQTLVEKHYWFGFLSRPNVPMIVFKDIQPTPLKESKTKAINNGVTKEFLNTETNEKVKNFAEKVGETVILSGKEIVEAIKNEKAPVTK